MFETLFCWLYIIYLWMFNSLCISFPDYLDGRSYDSPRHSRESSGYLDALLHEAPSPRPAKPPRDSYCESYTSQSVSSSLSSLLSSRPQKPERHKSPAGHNGSRERWVSRAKLLNGKHQRDRGEINEIKLKLIRWRLHTKFEPRCVAL